MYRGSHSKYFSFLGLQPHLCFKIYYHYELYCYVINNFHWHSLLQFSGIAVYIYL